MQQFLVSTNEGDLLIAWEVVGRMAPFDRLFSSTFCGVLSMRYTWLPAYLVVVTFMGVAMGDDAKDLDEVKIAIDKHSLELANLAQVILQLEQRLKKLETGETDGNDRKKETSPATNIDPFVGQWTGEIVLEKDGKFHQSADNERSLHIRKNDDGKYVGEFGFGAHGKNRIPVTGELVGKSRISLKPTEGEQKSLRMDEIGIVWEGSFLRDSKTLVLRFKTPELGTGVMVLHRSRK
ncbi:MAG: hypothetical protein IT428_11270 [Planctomycetaceae bacterium]|nr:hypothetical protein [Planctomycetaceae bacterium]